MIRVTDPFFMYMSEAEGMTDWIDTRESRKNTCIKELRRIYQHRGSTPSVSEATAILKKYKIYDDLTQKEWEHIRDEVLRGVRFA